MKFLYRIYHQSGIGAVLGASLRLGSRLRAHGRWKLAVPPGAVAADYTESEGAASFAAYAVAEWDGKRAEQRGHGCHHGGTEADETSLIDGLLRPPAFVAF